MKKLNKKITKQWLSGEDSFHRLRQFWSSEMRSRKELPCRYHLLYKALLGRDWSTGVGVDNTDLQNLVKSRYMLNRTLGLFSDFINVDKALEVLPNLIGDNEDSYKEEECQKFILMQ